MRWSKEYMDLRVAPAGVVIFLGYHLLLYTYVTHPQTTSLGSELLWRRHSVHSILQVEIKDRCVFTEEMLSKITSSYTYGSYSLAVMGAVVGFLVSQGTPSANWVTYGDPSTTTATVKCISILFFALAAFICFQAGAGFLGDVHFLVTVIIPGSQVRNEEELEKVVERGFVLLKIGFRAFYFALCLFFWFFGPIPMLVASLFLVAAMGMKDAKTILSQVEPQPRTTSWV